MSPIFMLSRLNGIFHRKIGRCSYFFVSLFVNYILLLGFKGALLEIVSPAFAESVAGESVSAGESEDGLKVHQTSAPGRMKIEDGLKDRDFKLRRQALNHLDVINHPRKVDLLMEVLDDEDPEIRQRAARLLGRSGSARAYELLVRALGSEDFAVRLGAIDGLRDLGDPRATIPLTSLLTHKDRNTRWKAVEALGDLKSDTCVDSLVKVALEDKDEFVRKSAVNGLFKIGTKPARVALQSLAKSRDKKLSGWATNALKAIEMAGR